MIKVIANLFLKIYCEKMYSLRVKNILQSSFRGKKYVSTLSFQSYLRFLPGKISVVLMFGCSGALNTKYS